jgi:hypothetical protein
MLYDLLRVTWLVNWQFFKLKKRAKPNISTYVNLNHLEFSYWCMYIHKNYFLLHYYVFKWSSTFSRFRNILFNLRLFNVLLYYSGPTSQDAETPSHSGFHPPHLLYNRRGLTRNNSEFRRPEMWAQSNNVYGWSRKWIIAIELTRSRHSPFLVGP